MKSIFESGPDGVKISFTASDKSNKISVAELQGKEVEKLSDTQILFRPTGKPTPNKVSASITKGNITDNLEVNILQHSTLGNQWELNPVPSDFYPGKGGFTLSDGVLGARPWNGKEWLGFDKGSTELSIELNASKKITTIHVSCLNAPSSWIYLPESMTVQYSKNGKKWKEKELQVSEELTSISIAKKLKFLKITLKTMGKIPTGKNGEGHTPWLFLDEVWME